MNTFVHSSYSWTGCRCAPIACDPIRMLTFSNLPNSVAWLSVGYLQHSWLGLYAAHFVIKIWAWVVPLACT